MTCGLKATGSKITRDQLRKWRRAYEQLEDAEYEDLKAKALVTHFKLSPQGDLFSRPVNCRPGRQFSPVP